MNLLVITSVFIFNLESNDWSVSFAVLERCQDREEFGEVVLYVLQIGLVFRCPHYHVRVVQ